MPRAKRIRESTRDDAPDRQGARREPSGAHPFGERREITALFYDLIDSTRLLTHSDLEDFQDVIGAFQGRSCAAVSAHGGSVSEVLGDGGLAFFGYPEPLEDCATAAIHAGLDIVDACRQLAAHAGWGDLHVRVGIATSDVVIQATEGRISAGVTGVAPVLASRLQSIAQPDSVVVSERTRRLARRHFAFRYLGPRRLKGFDEQQEIWGARRRTINATRFLALGRWSHRMIGREDELAAALAAWRSAVAGRGQALVLRGPAGIGKSRLAFELFRRIRAERARLIVFQCSRRGAHAALSPLVDLLRSASGAAAGTTDPTFRQIASLMRREGISDALAIERIAFAAGADVPSKQSMGEVGPQQFRERIVWAVRRCVEDWTRAGPIVIAVEDLHWIDPTSRDLLRDLAGWIRDKPVLLILTTRERPAWLDPEPHVTQITLDRLSAAEAGQLLADLLPEVKAAPLPRAAVSLIHQRTNGVPLYLEELSRWLAGAQATRQAGWMDLLSSARISSFENLLSARMGTSGLVKTVAQAASVIGYSFDEELLGAVLPDLPGDRLKAAIARLVDAQILVRRRQGAAPRYEFRHAAIQESLYGALLRKSRTALHRRIYLAATRGEGGGVPMGPAILADHAERAGLLKEAVGHYILAAKDSSARSAVVEARHLLERALGLLERIGPDDERERLELSAMAALGPVLTSTQGTKSREACRLYERAIEIVRRRPADEQAAWFPIYWGWWYTGADFGIQRERAAAVMSDLRRVEDPEVQLQVQHCVWAIDFNVGRHDTCIAAVDAGLALYQAGSGRESRTLYGGHDPRVCGLGQKGLSLWFKGFPTLAVVSAEAAVRWAHRIVHVGSIAHAYDIMAMLQRYRRDYGGLRHTAAAMRRLARKHDLPSLSAKALIFDGWRNANLGQPERGRKMAEEGFAIQREIGTREDFPVYSEMLAEILVRLSDRGSALDVVDEALREAELTGHLYWVPELYRRRALIGAEIGFPGGKVAALLDRALQVAEEQRATMLFLRAYDTVLALGLSDRVAPVPVNVLRSAMAGVEQGGEMATLLDAIAHRANGPALR